MPGHKFKIDATGHGMGTHIFMDGKELQNVTGYSLSFAVGRKSGTRLVLAMKPDAVEVVGETPGDVPVKRAWSA